MTSWTVIRPENASALCKFYCSRLTPNTIVPWISEFTYVTCSNWESDIANKCVRNKFNEDKNQRNFWFHIRNSSVSMNLFYSVPLRNNKSKFIIRFCSTVFISCLIIIMLQFCWPRNVWRQEEERNTMGTWTEQNRDGHAGNGVLIFHTAITSNLN